MLTHPFSNLKSHCLARRVNTLLMITTKMKGICNLPASLPVLGVVRRAVPALTHPNTRSQLRQVSGAAGDRPEVSRKMP